MPLPSLPADPIERRNVLVTAGLVATVVAVLGFGTGISSVLSHSSSSPSSRAGLAHPSMSMDTDTGATPAEAVAATTGMTGTGDAGYSTAGYSSGPVQAASASDMASMSGNSSSSSAASSSDTNGASSATTACPGLVTAMVDPFVVHFDKAHLETSPGQQAAQALNVDQYTKTHTVMFEMMLAPLLHLAEVAPNGIDPFVVHFDKAHLETSPGQQAAQATDVDQYTKTHTVLFEDMLAPATNTLTGSGSC